MESFVLSRMFKRQSVILEVFSLLMVNKTMTVKEWDVFYDSIGVDPRTTQPHPHNAFDFGRKISVEKIEDEMILAQNARDPTKALHNVISLYTSVKMYPVDKIDEVRELFETVVRKLVFRGANAKEAMDEIQPFETSSRLEISMAAREIYEILRNAKNDHHDAVKSSESEKLFKQMTGSGKRKSRKRSSSRKRSTRRSKTLKRKRSTSKRRYTNKRRRKH